MSANILDTIGHPRILVLGDLILDRYTFGNAERVSPEAPVVVLRVDSKEVRLGGAASVAMLLRWLEAEVTLAGVIGDDSDGRTLLKLLDDENIDRSMVLVDKSRPTTIKERFVGCCASRSVAGGQQILRVDNESQAPIAAGVEEWLALETATRLEYPWGRLPNADRSRIRRDQYLWVPPSRPSEEDFSRRDVSFLYSHISYDAILISDYAKGVCTERAVQMVMAKAGERRIPVIVDPARIADYDRYSYATLIKPNRIEAELATCQKIETPGDALAAAEQLREILKVESVIVTLDRDGMVIVGASPSSGEPNSNSELHASATPAIPNSHHLAVAAREVYDITGAGDMVLATLGLCIASGVPVVESAQLANIAAGLEVERLGVAPITRAELSLALQHLTLPLGERRGEDIGIRAFPLDSSTLSTPSTSSSKVISLPQAVSLAAAYRSQGKKIVFTNGCFDLLHIGHVTCLEQAASLGDILIVGINGDITVRELKGADRPVIPASHRAAMVAAVGRVDHVVIFDDATPHKLLEQIRPDILAKGGTTPEIVGREVVESYGGRAIRLAELPGVSTTALLATPWFNRAPTGSACRPSTPHSELRTPHS